MSVAPNFARRSRASVTGYNSKRRHSYRSISSSGSTAASNGQQSRAVSNIDRKLFGLYPLIILHYIKFKVKTRRSTFDTIQTLTI